MAVQSSPDASMHLINTKQIWIEISECNLGKKLKFFQDRRSLHSHKEVKICT